MKTKYYFDPDDPEMCFDEEHFQDFMTNEGLEEMEVIQAVKMKNSGMFWCRFHSEVGESGTCGRVCPGYKPRNKISGICKHHGPVYEHGPRINIKRES